MPYIRVNDNKTGLYVVVDAPEGASQQEIVRLAREKFKEKHAPGVGDYIREGIKGTAAGAVNLTELGILGALTPLGEENESAARGAVQEFFDPAQEYLAPRPLQENLGTRKFGEALGSFLPLLGLSAINPAGIAAAAGLAVGAGAGEASERARAYGASEEERGTAALKGAGVGATELLPVGNMLRILRKVDADTGISLTDRVLRGFASAGVEGAQEAGAGALQNMIAQGYGDDVAILEGTAEEAGYGAGVGGLVQMVLDLGIKGRRAATEGSEQYDGEGGRLEDGELTEPRDPMALMPEEEATPEQAELPGIGQVLEPQVEERPETIRVVEPLMDRLRVPAYASLRKQLQGKTLPRADFEAALVEYANNDPRTPTQTKQAINSYLEGTTELQERLPFMRGQRGSTEPSVAATSPAPTGRRQRDGAGIQRGLPGIGQQREPDVPERAETIRVVEPLMDKLKIPKTAAFRKRLQGQTLPRAEFNRSLTEYISNPNVSAQSKQAVTSYLDGVATEIQGTLPLKRGPASARPTTDSGSATPRPARPDRNRESVQRAVPAGDVTAGEPTRPDTEPAPQPDRRGLDNADTGPARPARGEGVQSGALAEDGVRTKKVSMPDYTEPEYTPQSDQGEGGDATAGNVTEAAARTESQLIAEKDPDNLLPAFYRDTYNFARTLYDVHGEQAVDNLVESRKASRLPELPKLREYAMGGEFPFGEVAEKSEDGTLLFRREKTDAAPQQPEQPALRELPPELAEYGDNARDLYSLDPGRMEAYLGDLEVNDGLTQPELDAVREFAVQEQTAPAQPATTEQKRPRGDRLQAIADAAEKKQASKKQAKKATPEKQQTKKGSTKAASSEETKKSPEKKTGSKTTRSSKTKREFLDRGRRAGEVKSIDPATLSDAEIAKYLSYMEKAEKEERPLSSVAQDVSEADPESEVQGVDEMLAISEVVGRPDPELDAYKSRMEDLYTGDPLPELATEALRRGDALTALRVIYNTTKAPRIAKVSRALFNVLTQSETKLKVVKGLKFGDTTIPGRFVPETNTIELDAEAGLQTQHTLLHEATHAVVAHKIDTAPMDPNVIQLKKLFEQVRTAYNGDFYGMSDVQEFAAEVMSNTKFQQLLGTMRIGDHSVLTRFFRAVANIVRTAVGMNAKQPQSALDAADQVIFGLMSPSPDTRKAGALHSAATEGDNSSAPFPMMKAKSHPQWVQTAVNYFQDTPVGSATKKLFAKTLGTNALTEVAEGLGIKNATDLTPLINKIGSASIRKSAPIRNLVTRLDKWRKQTDSEVVQRLFKVMNNSSRFGVDPSKMKPAKFKDADQEAKYDELKKEFDELVAADPSVRKVYTDVRDTYKELYNELKDVIFARIDAMDSDTNRRQQLKKLVQEKIFDKTVEPYFPLYREGDYWLSYVDKDGEFNVEAFGGALARARRLTQLQNDSGVSELEAFRNPSEKNAKVWERAPSESFVGEVLQAVRANVGTGKKAEAAVDQIMQTFIEIMPESSYAKAMQRRKGTLGEVSDAIYVLDRRGTSMASTIERMRIAPEIIKVMQKASQYVDNNGKNRFIYEEMQEHADYAIHPPNNWLDRLGVDLKKFGFLGTLGFNVSSSVVNSSQIPLVVVPVLAARHGPMTAMKAIGQAYALYGNSMGSASQMKNLGRLAEDATGDISSSGALMSLGNFYVFKKDGSLELRSDLEKVYGKEGAEKIQKTLENDGLDVLVRMADEQGQLTQTAMNEAIDLQEGEGATRQSRFDKLVQKSAFVFHHVERSNRQVTLLAAYKLELNKLRGETSGLTEEQMREQAAQAAIDVTQELHGGSSTVALPSIAKRGLWRPIMMYKPYGMAMYYLLFKTLRRAYKGDREAYGAAMGMLGSSFILAGVQGLPFYGVAAMVANLMAEDDEEDFETMTRKALGELAYKGPISHGLGTDIASRVGLSELVFRSNPYASSQSFEEQAFAFGAGPVYSVGRQMQRGLAEFYTGAREGDERTMLRGLEAASPAAVRNLFKTARYDRDDAYLTRRGDVIVDDLDNVDLAFQAMGFSPLQYTQAQERTQQNKRINRAILDQRTKLLKRYYVAMRFGDFEQMYDTLQDIFKFNVRHNDKGEQIIIDQDTMDRSMRSHMKTSTLMDQGVLYSPMLYDYAQRSNMEYSE